MKFINISIPEKEITAFCSQWDVEEFSLFGSVLSNEFNSESDIDVLISFSKDAEISLFDLAQMQIELQNIFNRPVDIIEKEALQNPYRKHQILETAQVIYEAKYPN